MTSTETKVRSGGWKGLVVLSAVIAVIGIVGALSLWFSPESGFLPGLGKTLAQLILGAAGLLCVVLNLAYLWLTRRRAGDEGGIGRGRRVLWAVTGLQLIPAVWFSVVIAGESLEQHAYTVSARQISAIQEAIRRNDPQAYALAYDACARQCRETFSRGRHMLEAVRYRAHKVAALLLEQGVRVSAGLLEPSTEVRTCEGSYLPAVSVLGMAVVNDDARMLELLLPASDGAAHRDALWIAAKLDRLERLQWMARAGLPLTIRGRILDENSSLLVAAASGAALRTAQWLHNTQGLPVHGMTGPDRHPGLSPLSALLYFAQQTESPRAAPFLQWLLQQGVDVDERRHDGLTWLQEAVRIQNKRLAQLLLQAGASRQLLTPEQSARLDQLLTSKDRQRQRGETEGCIPVAGTADASPR